MSSASAPAHPLARCRAGRQYAPPQSAVLRPLAPARAALGRAEVANGRESRSSSSASLLACTCQEGLLVTRRARAGCLACQVYQRIRRALHQRARERCHLPLTSIGLLENNTAWWSGHDHGYLAECWATKPIQAQLPNGGAGSNGRSRPRSKRCRQRMPNCAQRLPYRTDNPCRLGALNGKRGAPCTHEAFSRRTYSWATCPPGACRWHRVFVVGGRGLAISAAMAQYPALMALFRGTLRWSEKRWRLTQCIHGSTRACAESPGFSHGEEAPPRSLEHLFLMW